MGRLPRMICREIWFRWPSAVGNVLIIAAATALCLAISCSLEALDRETKRVTRDLGFNLRIIPERTDAAAYWTRGFSADTLPEHAVYALAERSGISINHLLATLHEEIELGGRPAILTGISPEIYPPGSKKTKMIPAVEPGTAHVGFDLAKRLQLAVGDTLTVGEQSWTVARCAPETGSPDDIRVTVTLAEAQAAAGAPDRISEIQAIDCLCLTADERPQEIIQRQVNEVVPGARVIMRQAMANTRARQRQLVQKYAGLVVPLVLCGAAICIAIATLLNVRQRQAEIGILRALGFGSGFLALLFLGKVVALTLAGAVAGNLAGWRLLDVFAPQIFQLTSAAVHPEWLRMIQLTGTVVGLTATAALVPAAWAISRQPAVILRHE